MHLTRLKISAERKVSGALALFILCLGIKLAGKLFDLFLWFLMFVVSIMFLIITPNIINILLGWDGLGLVSYLLVIYYQNVKSCGAGMLTVLSNRIGDVALLMVIVWIINFGSWSIIYYLEFLSASVETELISFLVVLAAITKSAQIPFSS